MPQVLCKECANMLVQSYLFKRLTVYSNNKWTEALTNLENGSKDTNEVNPLTECILVMVKKDESFIIASNKKITNKNKSVEKVNAIIKRSQDKLTESRKPKRSRHISSTCSKCGKTFGSDLLLTKHMAVHSDEKHPCPKCAKVFPTWKQVLGHIDRIHKPKNLQCNKCSKRFSTKPILAYHYQMHHVTANCKFCDLQFPSKYALRAHLDKHEVNHCPSCGKTYRNKNTFKMHLNICGNADKQPNFFCDICDKGYIRKNGIRTHLKVDHGFGKVLTCNWCNKKFDAISRLKMHTVKHTKERNFTCDLCGGKFVTYPALVYHKRLHTGEKPFPCDLCDESFLSASRRMEHKHRKHFRPTKECHLCDMKFVMASQLKKHVNRHYNPQSKLYIPVL